MLGKDLPDDYVLGTETPINHMILSKEGFLEIKKALYNKMFTTESNFYTCVKKVVTNHEFISACTELFKSIERDDSEEVIKKFGDIARQQFLKLEYAMIVGTLRDLDIVLIEGKIPESVKIIAYCEFLTSTSKDDYCWTLTSYLIENLGFILDVPKGLSFMLGIPCTVTKVRSKNLLSLSVEKALDVYWDDVLDTMDVDKFDFSAICGLNWLDGLVSLHNKQSPAVMEFAKRINPNVN